MKILFICGSFELGKDGVGDYTRKLATELLSRNHDAAVISFNDVYITSEWEGNVPEDFNLPVLRIPSSLNINKRIKLAQQWIESYTPTFISIQFVPYAYHNKGLPFNFADQLKPLLYKYKVHIMFHELWTGVSGFADVKGLLTSKLQKYIIRKMIKTLQPHIIHTQLPHYKTELQHIGYKVNSLPLFSNVEVAEEHINVDKNILCVGLFSQVSISKHVILFLKELEKVAEHNRMAFEILFIGGESNRVKAAANLLEQEQVFKNRIRHSGFLAPEKLSHHIQSCTLGLTPIPRHAVGKSGSVAAFLAHGIPVAAPNIEQKYSPYEIGFFSESLKAAIILTPDLGSIEKAAEKLIQAKGSISVRVIAGAFLNDLNRSGSEQIKKSKASEKYRSKAFTNRNIEGYEA